MATPTVAETCSRYLDAWRSRDVEAILAMHTDDSVFRLHVHGEHDSVGTDAVRTAFTSMFETWPDLSFSTVRLRHGSDHFVHEMDVWGTPLGLVDNLEGGTRGSGEPVHYDMVDVIEVRDGQIVRKDTYVDALAVMAATTATAGATQ
jgi:steroid delta-isomerase-like uncharacterized protein